LTVCLFDLQLLVYHIGVVVVLTTGLEQGAGDTAFEVALLPIEGDDGDTKNAFPPAIHRSSSLRDLSIHTRNEGEAVNGAGLKRCRCHIS